MPLADPVRMDPCVDGPGTAYIELVGHDVNGALATWDEVAMEQRWRNILLGNGLSSHIWKPFRYNSLFDEACSGGYLTAEDQALFEAFETENFEVVLSSSSTTIQALDALGDGTDHLFERYNSVKAALGHAVRRVHLELSQFPDENREVIKETLGGYRFNISRTSYDLLLYWAAASANPSRGSRTSSGIAA